VGQLRRDIERCRPDEQPASMPSNETRISGIPKAWRYKRSERINRTIAPRDPQRRALACFSPVLIRADSGEGFMGIGHRKESTVYIANDTNHRATSPQLGIESHSFDCSAFSLFQTPVDRSPRP
jgi:hypothetical protein